MFVGGEATRGLCTGQIIDLTDDQAHYIVSVMRLRNGSSVHVFDGVSGEFVATVCGVCSSGGRGKGGKRAGVASLRVENLTRPQVESAHDTRRPNVELFFAPIRKQRLKILIEKAVEVGVWRLTPVSTAWTQSPAADAAGALRKLRVTATEAAEQCERMDVPHVEDTPVALSSLLASWDRRHIAGDGIQKQEGESGNDGTTSARVVFVCKERDADAPPLLDALAEFASLEKQRAYEEFNVSSSSSSISTTSRNGLSSTSLSRSTAAFLVGPEGGFAPEELQEMAKYSFVRFVSLGPTVLRAETAAVYALSCWSAFWATRIHSPL